MKTPGTLLISTAEERKLVADGLRARLADVQDALAEELVGRDGTGSGELWTRYYRAVSLLRRLGEPVPRWVLVREEALRVRSQENEERERALNFVPVPS